MKFLVDAQFPRRMKYWFATVDCEAVHTSDLRLGNRISDALILATCELEHRVLVTKDSDFVSEHLLTGRPRKLLLISTGNVSNRDLEEIFVRELPGMLSELSKSNFVELRRDGFVIRG